MVSRPSTSKENKRPLSHKELESILDEESDFDYNTDSDESNYVPSGNDRFSGDSDISDGEADEDGDEEEDAYENLAGLFKTLLLVRIHQLLLIYCRYNYIIKYSVV